MCRREIRSGRLGNSAGAERPRQHSTWIRRKRRWRCCLRNICLSISTIFSRSFRRCSTRRLWSSSEWFSIRTVAFNQDDELPFDGALFEKAQQFSGGASKKLLEFLGQLAGQNDLALWKNFLQLSE